MDSLTTEEKNAVIKFRKIMKNVVPKQEAYKDDHLYYKYLKARNFNIKQAEAMLLKSIRWRKERQVDRILTNYEPKEVIKKYISQCFIGYDKDGCPIYYAALGNTDGKGLFHSANNYYILKYIIHGIEESITLFKTQTEKMRKPVTQCVYIYDMENMTLAKATHKKSLYLFMDGLSILQDNYPELLKRVYIINASLYFTVAFALVKTILASASVDKIRVFGENDWKEELLSIIDPDNLPAFLGGNRFDPDGNPRCITFVNFAGSVPESYYLVKDFEKYKQNEDVNFIRIERQSSSRVTVHITKPRSLLHWEFLSKSYDIGFGLHLKTSKNSIEELIPVHKIDTENEPHQDSYICEEVGTYHIIFDNTYSWIYSKEVFYRTWVTDCQDE